MYYLSACFFTVYAFDRRKGRDPGCTLRSMAEDVADAMKTLNINHVVIAFCK